MENETHCIETLVNPAKGGTETLWLLMVTAVILIGCGTAIGMRMHTNYEKRIETWQIDAFAELEAGEISIFNALQAAAEEINATHILEGDYWVSVAELEELYVPPFAHDAAWHKQGKIQWAMKMVATDDRHIALYLGHPQAEEIQSAFLLLLLHDHKKKQGNAAVGPTHAPYEIWINDKKNQGFPNIITDQALIAAGWKEIVALTGEDEIKRMKGTTINEN